METVYRIPTLRVGGNDGEELIINISVTDMDITFGINPRDTLYSSTDRARSSPLARAVSRSLHLPDYSINVSGRVWRVGRSFFGSKLLLSRRWRRAIRQCEATGKPFTFRVTAKIKHIGIDC